MKQLIMKCTTENPKEISYQMGSRMHGLLMELIGTDNAAWLHSGDLQPYSQHIRNQNGEIIWTVNSLNDAADEKVIGCLSARSEQTLQLNNGVVLQIIGTEEHFLDPKTLIRSFYNEDSSHFQKIQFITPTAFKQQGRYTFHPDLSCIYGSLMRKQNSISGKENMYDEDLHDALVKASEIIQYKLRSTKFGLEGVKISAFTGTITIRISGAQTIANYADMLFRFGEYSGIGIKTSLGMGGVQIIKRDGKDTD